MITADRSADSRIPLPAFVILFWMSGAAALIYQVLWLKQLGRLFGVTAYASSTTLAVFFLGLAVGGWVWSRRAPGLKNSLRTYAWLELGIAVSALLYFAMFALYGALAETVLGGDEYRPGLALLLKFLLAIGVLFLPSFLMGGTLPVMSEYIVARRDQLGTGVSTLYSANTLGAMAGALLAGFFLPRLLGFAGAYLVAVGLNLGIAGMTAWWSRTHRPPEVAGSMPVDPDEEGSSGLDPRTIRLIAAGSGAATLALEVIWTRMVAQVLQNSVYTFALILATFLFALAVGAGVANRIARRATDLRAAMWKLMLMSGVFVAFTPFVFRLLADRVAYEGNALGFWPYVSVVALGLLAILGPAVVVMGAIFPFLMRLSERDMVSAGRTVGELAAINTAAAIVGSLLAGFVLLGSFGVGPSIGLIAGLYLIGAAWISGSLKTSIVAVGLAVVAAVTPFLMTADERVRENEVIVESWERPDGTVAVTMHGEDNLRIRVNGSYSLGSSASAVNERLQGQLPILMHPDPQSVFFLGLGTGITASGAMHFPLETIDVCELNAGVVTAARKHFSPWLRGLFDDPRARVIPEDGRAWLSTHGRTYDVIVADVFLAYKTGVGSLYTREHFETVRSRLNPGGVFVQWIGVLDTTVEEFEIIARTMLEVFPSVTLWRRSFSPVFPVYAFVGMMEPDADPVAVYLDRVGELNEDEDLDPRTWIYHIPLASYVADLRHLEDEFADAPLNTDDRTRLEYSAPMTERNSKGGGSTECLSWEPLLRYCESMQQVPGDPRLAGLEPALQKQVAAGTSYYGYEVMRRLGREGEARMYLRHYERLVE